MSEPAIIQAWMEEGLRFPSLSLLNYLLLIDSERGNAIYCLQQVSMSSYNQLVTQMTLFKLYSPKTKQKIMNSSGGGWVMGGRKGKVRREN